MAVDILEPSPRSKANHLPSPPICAGDETVSPLTSAECLAIAERKIVEAMGDRRHGKELKLTAQAWMVLAEKVRQGEALQKQAEALKIAKLAPDIARTAASSHCGFLKQIADDIRSFHLEALEAQRRLPPTESDLSSRHHVSVAYASRPHPAETKSGGR